MSAFRELEKYLIINTTTNTAVQSSWDESTSRRDCATLNDHEKRNNRPAVYTFVKRSEFTGEYYKY